MLNRILHIFTNSTDLAPTCRKHLSLESTMTLLPHIHTLSLYALSDSPKGLLLSSSHLRITGESGSLLTEGDILSVISDTSDQAVTTVLFSDNAVLSKAHVSLTIPAGTPLLGALQLLCRDSVPQIPFSPPDLQDFPLSRPFSWHGSTVGAIRALASALHALPFFSDGALHLVSIAFPETPDLMLTPEDISGPVIEETDRFLVRTAMKGWPVGAFTEVHAPNASFSGRILARHIEADTAEGPWESILTIGKGSVYG